MAKTSKPAAADIPPEVRQVLERYDAAQRRVHEGDPGQVTDEDREELREAETAYRNLVTAVAESDAYQRANAPVTISAETKPEE